VKRLYTAAGLVEAYLVRDLLVSRGVDVLVFNEHSMGAVGQLPCNEALPELWLRDEMQYERARLLIREHERSSSESASRTCAACTEKNPASFDLCWRCGSWLDN
jgi:hypothetical protein